MTLPRVVSDLLILAPSFRRVPWNQQACCLEQLTVAPVEACRSEPAKSTREILETFSPVIFVSASCRFCVS